MAIKKKPKVSAPIRQRKLAKEIVENRGKPLGKAMQEAGYSKAYSTNPKQLTETKTWQQLMDEYLPDDLLAEKHRALLNKTDKGTNEPETNAVKAGLDMGYKLKGRFAPEQIEHKITAVKVVHYGDKDGRDNSTD